MRLTILYPDLKIIWSDILPRRYWHYGDNHGAIEGTRKRVNIAVRKVVKVVPLNGNKYGLAQNYRVITPDFYLARLAPKEYQKLNYIL
jgi:hypothetical protein